MSKWKCKRIGSITKFLGFKSHLLLFKQIALVSYENGMCYGYGKIKIMNYEFLCYLLEEIKKLN